MNPDTPGRKRTSPVWNTLKLILAVSLSIFVLSRTNLPELAATFRNASVFWLVVSTLLFISVTLLKALQYYILMGSDLSYSQVLHLIIWQNTVSNYFLTSAGIVTYVTMNRMEHEIKVSRSVTTFLLTKAGDLTAIWIILLVSTSLLWSQLGALQTPAVFLIIAIGIAVAAFFLTILLRQRFISFLGGFFDRLGLSRFRFTAQAFNYLQSIAAVEKSRIARIFGKLILFSLVYLGATLVWSYANLAIFHLYLQPLPFVFVFALIQLVSYIPVTVFGGLGITESSFLYFWNFFDVASGVLAPALVGTRVVFYAVNLIPLIYLPLYTISHGSKNKQKNGRQEP